MAEFSFTSLTPDLILDAIETTSIRVDSGLLALNSYENRVYMFLDENRQRFVVKFYRPERWTVEQLLQWGIGNWDLSKVPSKLRPYSA